MITAKKLIKFTSAIFVCLVITSCSPSLKKNIVGKWGDESGSMEFLSDGQLKITGPSMSGESITLHGKYTFIDGNSIKMDVNAYGTTQTNIAQIEIEKNKLIITDANGKREEATRIE
jgi:uncharacterized protein (TIGR03066 family)